MPGCLACKSGCTQVMSISNGRTTMRHAIKLILMVGVAAGAVMTVSGNWGHAQGTDPNAAPNPYKAQENWAQLTDGRKFGQAIKVQVDHSDGKSIWVFDRCGTNDCGNSMIPQRSNTQMLLPSLWSTWTLMAWPNFRRSEEHTS